MKFSFHFEVKVSKYKVNICVLKFASIHAYNMKEGKFDDEKNIDTSKPRNFPSMSLLVGSA